MGAFIHHKAKARLEYKLEQVGKQDIRDMHPGVVIHTSTDMLERFQRHQTANQLDTTAAIESLSSEDRVTLYGLFSACDWEGRAGRNIYESIVEDIETIKNSLDQELHLTVGDEGR